jgi:hypothetical protein
MQNDESEKKIIFIKKHQEKKNPSQLGLTQLISYPRYEIGITLHKRKWTNHVAYGLIIQCWMIKLKKKTNFKRNGEEKNRVNLG